jgi:uncharacterized protein YcbK (DUF882 family)
MMLAAAVAMAAAVAAAPADRFFIMGDGTLALVSVHTGTKAKVSYRRPDGTYDPAALADIRRVMRSRDGGQGEISLRLVELLGYIYAERRHQPLRIQSGYRSVDYNEAIRAKGAKAAGGSLHTEGLAADVAFPPKELKPLWLEIRKLECCGAGYYQKNGFLHLDVGRPRFWQPATSKVEENLSAGNARLFARTEFDRYAKGETIVVALHALTLPPVRVAKDAVLSADGREQPVHVEASLPEEHGCFAVDERGVHLRVTGVPATTRGMLVLKTCEPRLERTPATIETNPIAVRAAD